MATKKITASLAVAALLGAAQLGFAGSALGAPGDVTLNSGSGTVAPGESVEFTLEGCGEGPINYTWMSDSEFVGQGGYDQTVVNTYRVTIPQDFTGDSFTVDADCWIESPFGGDRDVIGESTKTIMVEAPAADEVVISTNTAGPRPIGVRTHVWGTATGAQAGDKVATQVKLSDGRWVTSRTGVLKSDLGYVLPLTYASDVAGPVTYRVVVQSDDGTVTTSQPFTFTRTATITTNSAGTKRVGEQAFVWGSFHGGQAGDRMVVQVKVDGRWVNSRETTLNANKGYLMELSYGRYEVGVYTYRVVAVTASGYVVSDQFQLTRTR